MLRRLFKKLLKRLESSRKWHATKRFMRTRSMVHALADSGALTPPQH